jgi:hypothetical protein
MIAGQSNWAYKNNFDYRIAQIRLQPYSPHFQKNAIVAGIDPVTKPVGPPDKWNCDFLDNAVAAELVQDEDRVRAPVEVSYRSQVTPPETPSASPSEVICRMPFTIVPFPTQVFFCIVTPVAGTTIKLPSIVIWLLDVIVPVLVMPESG